MLKKTFFNHLYRLDKVYFTPIILNKIRATFKRCRATLKRNSTTLKR